MIEYKLREKSLQKYTNKTTSFENHFILGRQEDVLDDSERPIWLNLNFYRSRQKNYSEILEGDILEFTKRIRVKNESSKQISNEEFQKNRVIIDFEKESKYSDYADFKAFLFAGEKEFKLKYLNRDAGPDTETSEQVYRYRFELEQIDP